jgi:hypothetical protein
MVLKMSIKTVIVVLIMSALVLGPLAGSAVANVPGVALNAPPPPPAPNVPVQGGTGLFKVIVSHRDTMIPATHYIDHVYLFDGTNLLKEWKYTEKDANQNEVFTESLMLPAMKDMNLKAIAHCTLHGYNLNGVHVTVLPAGTTPAQMVQQNADIAGMQVNGMDPSTAASTATQMVQQDAQLLKQIESSETGMIRQHQMQTARFFQTPQGQKFLDAFDYTKKAGAAGQQGMAAPGQAGQGQMMQGQQGMAAQGQQGMQGQRVNMAHEMSGMQAGARDGMVAQGQPGQGQMMQGQQAAGMMKAPADQGIPQTMWSDSMGNPMDGNAAIQMGQAAATMQQGAMAGQTGQGQMMQGQQGMAGDQAGQGQMMQGQMAPGQMAQGRQGMAG